MSNMLGTLYFQFILLINNFLIDKSFEAFTGFINVLPGAFSAYRWDAIKKNE
jgi:cellulose synthase/poly-beta-1,6-N-acetylglucosamine synthase-like glycosyltransferase